MSSTLPKCIALIVKRIHFGDLLDCPLFATKPPFHPRSSRSSFLKCLYTKHFTKQALLDLPESLIPRGEVHQNRGNSRHFPRGVETTSAARGVCGAGSPASQGGKCTVFAGIPGTFRGKNYYGMRESCCRWGMWGRWFREKLLYLKINFLRLWLNVFLPSVPPCP